MTNLPPQPQTPYRETESSAKRLMRLARHIRVQIAAARAAGADENDFCILIPAGYFALILSLPTVEFDGVVHALTILAGAQSMVDDIMAEMSARESAGSDSGAYGPWQTL
jgi:hypothetical protein